MSNYVYIKSEPQLWTVGFYDPDGRWHPVEDFSDDGLAEEKVMMLNGTITRTRYVYGELNDKILSLIREAMRLNNELTAVLIQMSVWTKEK